MMRKFTTKTTFTVHELFVTLAKSEKQKNSKMIKFNQISNLKSVTNSKVSNLSKKPL